MITNKINADLLISEPRGGIRFGTDALLLADFALPFIKGGRCIDLGTGSGVLPLLLLGAGCKANFTGLELQSEYADISSENARKNGFSERFEIICGDAHDYKSLFKAGQAEYVITNPPYMRADCGFNNANAAMDIARREISGGAELFCKAAAWCLKSGGSFFAVYRPDRLAHIICAMKSNSIEPKRLRAVIPENGKKPSLVLIEGRKDGREGLDFESDLVIYSDPSHTLQTEEMQSIYDKF